jgi:hypothetical protein
MCWQYFLLFVVIAIYCYFNLYDEIVLFSALQQIVSVNMHLKITETTYYFDYVHQLLASNSSLSTKLISVKLIR